MRRLYFVPFLFLLFVLLSTQLSAQTTNSACGQSKATTLYCMPILSTEQAFRLPATTGTTENFVVQSGFVPVTSAIGTQFSTLPTPTPASGMVFSFGPGGLTAERELGPIFSNAPWTVGRHKLYVAFAYQHFAFNKIGTVSFHNIPLELNACISTSSPTCGPFVQTKSQYSLSLNEFISYASFGLTSRIDVSVMIPVVDTKSAITTTCSVCVQPLDYTLNGVQATMGFTPNSARETSSGIGDVTASIKADLVKGENFGLAAGVDVRTSSGDAEEFRGAGTVGVHPYAAIGYRARFSPHLNAGFLVNGKSILASTDGLTPAHLPNSFDYAAGGDFSIARWLSVSGDFLGQTFFDASSVAVNQTGLALHTSTKQTINTSTIAAGLKIVPFKHLLISANALIPVGNSGLHYGASPMIGISYTF